MAQRQGGPGKMANRRTRGVVLGAIGLGALVGASLSVRYLRSGSGVAMDAPPVGVGEEGRDLSTVDRTVEVAGYEVRVSVAPRPPAATRPLRFSVRFVALRASPAVTAVDLAFDQDRDGEGEEGRSAKAPAWPVTTTATDDGGLWMADDVVLPARGSGPERWRVRVRFTAGGERHETLLVVALAAPAPEGAAGGGAGGAVP